MKMMREGMQMMSMSGAQGGMKMAMMEGTKSTKSHEKGEAENCPMMGEHGMMGKRMDMMQMMMEQMMQHQQVIESSPK